MSKTETQNPTPKTEATHTPFASFDPMTAWTTAQQTFHKMFADAQARAQAFTEEYAALEAQMYAKAQASVANWAQLTQDAIAYSAQLSQQARKLGAEAARKMGVGA
ncbi:MAG: hypothetical protein JWO36_6287 [Myxococcales bacterium]|nr:hypothetical protein [Myxococcales bacterium]